MRNYAQKKPEHKTSENEVTAEQVTTENVVEFVARSRLIAQQSEEACHLEGNNNSPDYDVFEDKYGLGCFA